jgi:hypothetical protein
MLTNERTKPMSDYIELIVSDDEATNVKELSLYLSQLEKLYAFLLRRPELIKQAKAYSQNSEFSDSLISEEALLQALQESKYSSKNLMQYQNTKKLKGDLDIVRLSKNSPLEIVFAAVIPFLAAAIVLSGGKVDIESLGQKIKFNIPSLGTGLLKFQEFRERFKDDKEQRKLPIEERKSVIKITKSRDLNSEIKALKRARGVIDINPDTFESLTLEIEKKENEMRRLE